MNESIFRISAGLILFTAIGISSYYRRKADRESGEKIARSVDGRPMMTIIKLAGLVLWFSPVVYLIHPPWMVWSKIGLADALRWVGVLLGIFCVTGIYWLFSSIGSGITPTSATRQQHSLVTSGPYRWVRHPLYTIGSSLFIAVLGILTFVLMAIRTPKEEANLIEKFGDEYREYMKRTGRFLPKLGS